MSSSYDELLRRLNSISEEAEVRRKCFVSYFAGDTDEVDKFVSDYKEVFIPKIIGVSNGDDFIDSNNSDYVMSQIRKKYLGDSTVTIMMIGSCTHSRRYIDWELKASLRQGSYTPNGLLGILLPSMGNSGHLPDRFKENWEKTEKISYGIYRAYPDTNIELRQWIETCYSRRDTHAKFIKNSQSMMKYNRKCKVHDVTH